MLLSGYPEKSLPFPIALVTLQSRSQTVLVASPFVPPAPVLKHTPLSCVSQAGTVRGRGRAATGNRTPGPRGSYLGGYSAGRGIYSRYHEGKTKLPEKPYELMPGLELAASVNQVGIKPGTSQ